MYMLRSSIQKSKLHTALSYTFTIIGLVASEQVENSLSTVNAAGRVGH